MLPNQSSAINSPAVDLLAAALEYAGRGWSIIPVVGKKPVWEWKNFQEQPADLETLRRMFSRPDITGLAVILGRVSGGLACRDFDTSDAYRTWAAAHPDLAAILPTVQTARGFHVYFTGPEDYQDLGDGEYRADARHIVVLPPSLHPNGHIYRWLNALPAGELQAVDPVAKGLLTHLGTPPGRSAGVGGGAGGGSAGAPTPGTGTGTQATQLNTHTTHLCEQGAIPTAIADTLPRGIGQRRTKLFHLARRLKSNKPTGSAAEFQPIVRQWFDLALPVIGTKEWPVTWKDFIEAWDCVRHTTDGSWDEIVASAELMAVDVGHYVGAAASIIRLAAALQSHAGEGVAFPLSCRKAACPRADEVGISYEWAARVIKSLVSGGVLKLVEQGGDKGSRIAATYVFLGANPIKGPNP